VKRSQKVLPGERPTLNWGKEGFGLDGERNVCLTKQMLNNGGGILVDGKRLRRGLLI